MYFAISVVLQGNLVLEFRPILKFRREVNWYTWTYFWVCVHSWLLECRFRWIPSAQATASLTSVCVGVICAPPPPLPHEKKGRFYCFVSFFAFMQVVNIGEFAVQRE